MDDQTKRTTIRSITGFIIKQVTNMGYNVYVSYSRKTKSRYLEMSISKAEWWVIRISDHPPAQRRCYTFDIYTDTPRIGAVDYRAFINSLKQITRSSSDEKAGI